MDHQTHCSQGVGRSKEMDELLEEIWIQAEEGKGSKDEIMQCTSIQKGEGWLEILVKESLVEIDGAQVTLTETGRQITEQIIRRHRLTERLFADVFKVSEAVWEREACELEHQTVLVDEAVDAVCSFLGHPPTCPHGKPIPRGVCCSTVKKEVRPFVVPLSEANISESYRIVYMTPQSHIRLDRLSILGIMPGSEIRVHQKKPSYVIRIGETDVALDQDIVQDIYVRRMGRAS